MKKLLYLYLFLTGSLMSQTVNLTLSECLEIGLLNSKELKISKSNLTGSRARIKEATSQLLPRLMFSANYTRLSDIPPFEVQVPFAPNPIKISETILNAYNLRLSLQQPLFTGFRLSSLQKVHTLNSDAAALEYTKEINEAALKIRSAFWNYYRAGMVKGLISEMLSQTEKHLNDSREFMLNGLATKNDLLKIEVQYSNSKLLLIEAENRLGLARIAFNQALGYPMSADTRISAREILPAPPKYNIGALLEEAKGNRVELKALGYRVEAGEAGIRAANSGWLPSVYLTGNLYYNRPNQRILPALDKFKETWDVGVSLNWDLWNWGYTSSQTTIAEQAKIQAETTLAQLKEAIEIDVYQNYLSLNSIYEKVEVSAQSVSQAKENYRITAEKYGVQLETSTELIDSEVALLQAKTNYSNALIDFELMRIRLEKSIGRKIY